MFFDSLSDQPLERMAWTPLRRMASMTVRVILFGSDTTILPKPMYMIFFLDLRALSIKLIKSAEGCHFLDPTSASSRNQYPRIRSVKNKLQTRYAQTRNPDPFWPVQRCRDNGRAKIVKKWELMWLHLVQRCARKPQGITSPSIDLSGCSPPENLVKHHIRLLLY